MRNPNLAAAAAITVAVSTLGATGALAAGPADSRVGSQGDCTQSSQWKLDAQEDNGRIRVDWEVDTGIKGQHWSWRLLHNGGESFRGNAVTKDGGSYKLEKLVIDAPGTDRIVLKSHNAATGEQCRGSLRF
jgi:hypothetical protein